MTKKSCTNQNFICQRIDKLPKGCNLRSFSGNPSIKQIRNGRKGEKGNDTISETYNAGWIIIRSRIHMNKKADYSAPICASLWLEPYAQPVIANVLIRFKQNGSILAEARFELCVMNLPRRRVVRFSFIEFPEGLAGTVPSGFPVFADKHVPDEALINQYYRTVR